MILGLVLIAEIGLETVGVGGSDSKHQVVSVRLRLCATCSQGKEHCQHGDLDCFERLYFETNIRFHLCSFNFYDMNCPSGHFTYLLFSKKKCIEGIGL